METLISDNAHASFIISEQNNEEPSYGVLNGYSGMAIVYYLLARYTGDDTFKTKGLALLDHVSEHIEFVQELQFENGLAGIGWAVEWLVQNDLLLDTDTDEVLEDVDDTLYKSIVYAKERHISLLNGILGKIAYYLKREKSVNPGTHRFRRICHQECLVLLTDDLAERLTGENGILNTFEQYDRTKEEHSQLILDISTALTLLSTNSNINKQTVETILYEIVTYIERIMENAFALIKADGANYNNIDYYFDLLDLSVCYLIAGENHKHNYWQSQALNNIEQLKLVLKGYDDLNEYQLFKKLNIYSLLNIHIPKEEYQEEIKRLISLITRNELKFSLFNGWGAAVIAELSLNNPGLIKNWDELFFIK